MIVHSIMRWCPVPSTCVPDHHTTNALDLWEHSKHWVTIATAAQTDYEESSIKLTLWIRAWGFQKLPQATTAISLPHRCGVNGIAGHFSLLDEVSANHGSSLIDASSVIDVVSSRTDGSSTINVFSETCRRRWWENSFLTCWSMITLKDFCCAFFLVCFVVDSLVRPQIGGRFNVNNILLWVHVKMEEWMLPGRWCLNFAHWPRGGQTPTCDDATSFLRDILAH